MPPAFTEHGRAILTELSGIAFVCLTVWGNDSAFIEQLNAEHEERKNRALDDLRPMVEPLLQPGQNVSDVISYTGTNLADENREHSMALEKFVAEGALTRAVDLYHWYLRHVVELALIRDRNLIRTWAPGLDLKEKKIVEIEQAQSIQVVLAGLFRGRERAFRELVHEFLNVPTLGAIPLLVEARNCIVHHRSVDGEGRVARLLGDCPELGLKLTGGRLVVNWEAAYEGVTRVASDLTVIDPVLGRMLKLPTSSDPIPTIRRVR